MQLADFTTLAPTYSRYRSGYSESVREALLALPGRPVSELDLADVGAGTGIWTRMLAARGPRSLVAVEPNAAMRAAAEEDSAGLGIEWRAGSGEDTGLAERAFDMVSMASSFHWVDFERGTAEFRRILRPGGWFVALWNPRLLERSELHVEIESWLLELEPGLVRNSSGASGRTEALMERLGEHPAFDDLRYLEGEHEVRQSPEQFLGAWRSVNDVQAQLGPERFATFLERVERRIAGLEHITTTFWTRAWAARRR